MSKTFYVNNLGNGLDLVELESVFSTVGDVASMAMEKNPLSTRDSSYGIFEMANEQQAADCIERFNGESVSGQRLSVTPHKPVHKIAPPKKIGRVRGKR